MKILVLNTGSGSQRCSLFDLREASSDEEPQEPVWEANLDTTRPGQPKGKILLRVDRGGCSETADTIEENATVAERTRRLLTLLWNGPAAALGAPTEIDVIGHRVVHGGGDFAGAVRVDAGVEKTIERLDELAPLHNANSLIGIREAREVLGERVMNCAVFDTAFHRTLADAASTYAGPRSWLRQGIRRYGFHGTSFRWASERAADLLGRRGDPELRLILCHLGGGCSLCATRGGRSVDTTMGFTPLDGIAMSTRSGAIDPGILIYLLRRGRSADELETMLNKQSGLKGLSEISGDTRVLLPKLFAGDERAKLAWDVFVHRLRAGIGQMLASLAQVPHAFVFTDAIAESEPAVRAAACEGFGFLGLQLDSAKNASSPLDADLADTGSSIRVLLVKSREAWQIARECRALAEGTAQARASL